MGWKEKANFRKLEINKVSVRSKMRSIWKMLLMSSVGTNEIHLIDENRVLKES